MPELPIVTLVRAFLERGKRPAGVLTCAACYAELGPNEGKWVREWRAVVCDDACEAKEWGNRSW